ncbi:alpha/beta hydrolase [Phaeodactylibacter luteus]|uniref:Lysophospholipase n=1 Tax=Phaeodactylibacter luteus TaxID=1564516 RepID=A0A5C6RNQ9_9BACT|nr:alpha/beta hydrolase [Phaeodactylibacter luteus]TXB63579.1 lysophospholipase [Phaeodactylibacter luteus]
MNTKHFQWLTPDQIEIKGISWAAEAPRAVIALAHGLGEHAGRYGHLAAWFNKRGISVVAYDRRGHGASGGKRGHSPDVGLLMDEIAQLLTEVAARYPGLPIFLYGHSQGGGLVLSYALRRKPEVAGIIATSPWIRLAFQPPALLLALGRLMRRVYPGFSQPNGLDASDLSHDKAVVDAYRADPLVHDRVTAGVAIGMMEEGEWLLQQRGGFPAPLLLLHGADDRITSPKATEQLASQLKGDTQFKAFPGLYHEMHNEPQQEELFGHILQWMEARLPA